MIGWCETLLGHRPQVNQARGSTPPRGPLTGPIALVGRSTVVQMCQLFPTRGSSRSRFLKWCHVPKTLTLGPCFSLAIPYSAHSIHFSHTARLWLRFVKVRVSRTSRWLRLIDLECGSRLSTSIHALASGFVLMISSCGPRGDGVRGWAIDEFARRRACRNSRTLERSCPQILEKSWQRPDSADGELGKVLTVTEFGEGHRSGFPAALQAAGDGWVPRTKSVSG